MGIQKEELTEIWRQQDLKYRAAEKRMAIGDVLGGFEDLDGMGLWWSKKTES